MASINMSIRTDSTLKLNAEQVLSQLGMSMNGAINMFLQQIVRDQAVHRAIHLCRPFAGKSGAGAGCGIYFR